MSRSTDGLAIKAQVWEPGDLNTTTKLCHRLDMWLWADQQNTLCFCFPTGTVGTVINCLICSILLLAALWSIWRSSVASWCRTAECCWCSIQIKRRNLIIFFSQTWHLYQNLQSSSCLEFGKEQQVGRQSIDKTSKVVSVYLCSHKIRKQLPLKAAPVLWFNHKIIYFQILHMVSWFSIAHSL